MGNDDDAPLDPVPSEDVIPRAGEGTPPSAVLNQSPAAGMASQADMGEGSASDERLERQRLDNINPSLAREQPPDET